MVYALISLFCVTDDENIHTIPKSAKDDSFGTENKENIESGIPNPSPLKMNTEANSRPFREQRDRKSQTKGFRDIFSTMTSKKGLKRENKKDSPEVRMAKRESERWYKPTTRMPSNMKPPSNWAGLSLIPWGGTISVDGQSFNITNT